MDDGDFNARTPDPPPLANLTQPLAYYRSIVNSWPAVLRAIGIAAVVLGFLSMLELLWDFRFLTGGSILLRLLTVLCDVAGGIAGAWLFVAGLFALPRRPCGRAFFVAACWSMVATNIAQSFSYNAWSYSQGSGAWSAAATVAQAFVYPIESSLLPALMIFLISRPSMRTLFVAEGTAHDQSP